uniref:Uncharacterized protein n=1 Tax=Anguilla anguilla TaxID=7936 RepID=A0A0E9QR94_ANGAN
MQGTSQLIGSNLRVRRLAQGHFDMPRPGDRTGNPLTARQPLLTSSSYVAPFFCIN